MNDPQRPHPDETPAERPLVDPLGADHENSPGETASSSPQDDALADYQSGTPAADQGGEENSMEAQLQSCRHALRDAEDRLLRSQADLENYRKRVRREIDEERRFAALPLMRDLLPMIDNLDRAIGSVQPDESAAGLLEGVKMVAQQLTTVMQNHNCQAISAEGQDFDPNWHEAIAEHPSEEYAVGKVMLVAQTGYRLHDRVIRPSQVIVSKGAPGD